MVFSIAVDSSKDNDYHLALADSVALLLDSCGKGFITAITAIRPDVQQEYYQYYYHHFPLLIDSSYYALIDEKTQPASISQSIHESYLQLTSPSGMFIKNYILNDPIHITSAYFKELNLTQNSNHYIVEDGLVYTPGKRFVLITARLNYSSRESEKNVALSKLLETASQSWNAQHPNNQLSYFGTFEIAAQNAIQISKDTSLTLILSLVLILLVLFVFYRRITIPVLFVLPGIFGCLVAIGLMGWIRPEISAISLATGAIVLGIILDYSFHFFTHLQHTQNQQTTIREISAPLLTGSITTILALLALNFTNSVILSDFGLFAAIALAGSALFTLGALPAVLTLVKFNVSKQPHHHYSIPSLPQKAIKPLVLVIGILTLLFYQYAATIRFNSDVESLSFHPQSLKQKEEMLTGINPSLQKKVYLIATDSLYQNAAKANFKAGVLLKKLVQSNHISNVLSSADFMIPDSVRNIKQQTWNTYWQANGKRVMEQINHDALQAGFNIEAFKSFDTLINHFNADSQLPEALLNATGMDLLIDSSPYTTTFISSFTVNTQQKDSIKALFRQIDGITIFDRSEMASLLLESVRSDFNYLLYITAGIVFITLLIIYGRIELTLLAFLPMVISWIWILGIANIFHIEFNFVNIVIATFIFGLGDDFSIFVTDGLLHRYKYGKNTLASYQIAIFLSALTVIIGTGVLIFAKHPAIHSIAAISVIGISCILLMSFVVQPFLFHLFVSRRIKAGHTPIPFFQLMMSVFCFTYFIAGCLLFYPALLLIRMMPAPVKAKQRFVNFLTSKFAASVIYSGIHVRKRFINLHQLDFSKPSIIIANHASFLDILLMLMLNPKVVIMVKNWVYQSPLFGFVVRYVGYIYSESGTEDNIEHIRKKMNDGYSVMIFPEGTRSDDGNLGRFHKGAFYLAEKLQADIQPIMIHGAADVSPRREMLVKEGSITVKALPRIKAGDVSWGHDYRSRQKSISKYFKYQYALFKDETENASYLWRKVFYNYIFKGPVLEWYGRIKWKLEQKNYDFYHQLIDHRKIITDLGCGYGFMDLFLHYKNPDRNIVGIDYDEDKIAIAENTWNKNTNLQFYCNNIAEVDIRISDVIFLNDVLHYLLPEMQTAVINKCIAALNPDGILVIRDGVSDDQKHSQTKITELLSTKIFSFNKKENQLHFFPSTFIHQIAASHQLKLEEFTHSTTTSNRLFILRKS